MPFSDPTGRSRRWFSFATSGEMPRRRGAERTHSEDVTPTRAPPILPVTLPFAHPPSGAHLFTPPTATPTHDLRRPAPTTSDEVEEAVMDAEMGNVRSPTSSHSSDADGADSLEETEEDVVVDGSKPDASLAGLREISSLASWTVSTYKPGNGVAALRHPSHTQFWQSDGPQPHLLNIHFFKLVAIAKLRVYLDFELDESYTPTKMVFAAGMSTYDLTEFATWEADGPKGWVDIDLTGVGGRDKTVIEETDFGLPQHGGDVLKAMLVQIRVCENHQNGKDTHVRGVQVFARDDRGGGRQIVEEKVRGISRKIQRVTLEEPDWLAEPILR